MGIAARARTANNNRHACHRRRVINRIGAQAAIKNVSPKTADQKVILGAAKQRIGTIAARQRICTCRAGQHVCVYIAGQTIGQRRSGDVFHQAECIARCITATAGIGEKVNNHTQR